MTSPAAPLLRVLPTVLFCLTLTGAADDAASGGPVVGWGEVPVPDAVNGVSGTATDVSVGELHRCAIQAGTGSVVCWGDNSRGQATPPDAVNGVSGTATDIAAGGFHALAIAAPEPSGWLMLVAGTAFLGLLYRRRARGLQLG